MRNETNSNGSAHCNPEHDEESVAKVLQSLDLNTGVEEKRNLLPLHGDLPQIAPPLEAPPAPPSWSGGERSDGAAVLERCTPKRRPPCHERSEVPRPPREPAAELTWFALP